MKKEKPLDEKVKSWYESYDNPPPWTSLLGFVVREISKAKESQKQKILNKIKCKRHKDQLCGGCPECQTYQIINNN